MKRERIHFGLGAAVERMRLFRMWWLVDELEKERRGQIVAGFREHGLIAKAS
jgi:hypothetical protein